jgi:hypothetical protein
MHRPEQIPCVCCFHSGKAQSLVALCIGIRPSRERAGNGAHPISGVEEPETGFRVTGGPEVELRMLIQCFAYLAASGIWHQGR